MRRGAVWLAGLGLLAAVVGTSSAASTTWTHGYDVSWPQCHGTAAGHLPGGSPAYVILGLTDGRGHTANPCFAAQLSWARDRGARIGGYLVPSFPSPAQRAAAGDGPFGVCGSDVGCRLKNDGAAQAADAVAVMRHAGVAVPMVWVDVEFRHTYVWSRDHGHNRNVLTGVFRGLRDAGVAYGVYSTSYMWDHITADWHVDVPNWIPSGTGDSAATRRMCGTTATGGTAWLVQLTREWDEDQTCPAMDGRPGRPGPLWPYRHTTLQPGASGSAVSALQRALHVSVSGSYETQTTLAVVEFQKAHGLPPSGIVDEDDWHALGAFKRVGERPFLLLQMTAT